MFIILTYLFTFVTCYQSGTLKTNTISQVLMGGQTKWSVLVRFDIYDDSEIMEDFIACTVSNKNLTDQSLTLDQLVSQPREEDNIYYDYQSIQLKHSTQLVEMKFANILYLRCQTFNKKIYVIKYEIFQTDNREKTCINDCNGYDYPKIQQSICTSHFCFCQNAYFGNFCQFTSSYLLRDIQIQASIKPNSWRYFTYQYGSKDLVLLVNDENENPVSAKFALVVKVSPQILVPIYENLQLVNNGTRHLAEILALQEGLAGNIKERYPVIYIGFYNDQSAQVSLRITLQVLNSDDGMATTNLIVIIVTGCIVGFLLLLSFIISVWKTRQQQELDRERELYIQQVRQELQQNIVQSKKNRPGFSHQFIREYFKAYKYGQIIEIYPKLRSFEECIICLESLKQTNEIQTDQCGVMPCFHIFHHSCLAEWLSKQRTCPLCRQYYHRKNISDSFPWVIPKKIKVPQNVNEESMNIAKTDQTTIQNNINESQMDFVQKLEESSLG